MREKEFNSRQMWYRDTISWAAQCVNHMHPEPIYLNGDHYSSVCIALDLLEYVRKHPEKACRFEQKEQTFSVDGLTIRGTYPTCTNCGGYVMGLAAEDMKYCPFCGAEVLEE